MDNKFWLEAEELHEEMDKPHEECGVFGARESVTVQAIPPLFARIDFKTLAPEIEKIREQIQNIE